MKKIKDILLVSYIKNKGIRRLCFVVGLCSFLWLFTTILTNISSNAVNEQYKNLEEANYDLYFSHEFNTQKWYRKVECMNIYLKKYGLKRIAWAFTSYERAIDTDYWCDYYSKECNMLKAMKDEPIHLNCSPLESYEHSEFYSIIFLFIFLSVTFYLPFISVCTIKAIFKIFKWIISGFIESNPSQKNATNKHKRER